MSIPSPSTYLTDVTAILKKHWPDNRTVNLVCHGHSVPAGYFATPLVDTFHAYPHQLHLGLKDRYPYAVTNVIVSAIGGENSEEGAARFQHDVLDHHPDVITIDYGLNDRRIGLDRARSAWSAMIRAAIEAGARILLLTPTLDSTQAPGAPVQENATLAEHAAQIRDLADTFAVGLVDSFAASHAYLQTGQLSDLLSWGNHPNRTGHEIVARELLRWFPIA